MSKWEYDYTERPKQFDRKDFWRQVRRTINGEPVDESQIQLIQQQIHLLLNLNENDNLLDIGCGNGALISPFSKEVNTLLGIDISDYLIEIANEFFSSDNVSFKVAGIGDVIDDSVYTVFNKVVLYGVSSFIDDKTLLEFIIWYFKQNNRRLMLGNVRDRELAREFYGKNINEHLLNDISSSMGIWRNKKWFEKIADDQGLNLEFHKMPQEFYANKYYFDVVLTNS